MTTPTALERQMDSAMTPEAPDTGQEARVSQGEDGPCEAGGHCCCCAPGERCCDCGQIMPDPDELHAVRHALSELLTACRAADAKEDLSLYIDGELLDRAADALDLQYPIIWTPEQVAMLQQRQAEPMAHPYTCGTRSDTPEMLALHQAQADEDGDAEPGLLIPTARGWVCPACDYRQFWSNETGEAARLTPPAPVDAEAVERVALADVAAERDRQVSVEGWTPEHDDKHRDGSMALAAACYAMFASVSEVERRTTDLPGGLATNGKPLRGWAAFLELWPWDRKWWKPKSRRRDLVRAAALIIAEIERLDRKEKTRG